MKHLRINYVICATLWIGVFLASEAFSDYGTEDPRVVSDDNYSPDFAFS